MLVNDGVYATGKADSPTFGPSRIAVPHSVTLRSVNGPSTTRIEGSMDRFEAIRCAHLATNAVLDGFHLRGGVAAVIGGGVLAQGGLITNCVISGNSSGVSGGGGYGGHYKNCLIHQNSSQDGGGIAQSEVFNCRVYTNHASVIGGGIAHSIARNSVIMGNRAGTTSSIIISNSGGGVFGGELFNCAVIYNHTQGDGGGGVSDSKMFNTIAWYNSANIGPNLANVANLQSMAFSCTTPLPAEFLGRGNISADPQIRYDGRLANDQSPCRGAGSALYASGADLEGDPWKSPPSIGADESFTPGLRPLTISLRLFNSSGILTRIPLGERVTVSVNTQGSGEKVVVDFGDGTTATYTALTNDIAFYTNHIWTDTLGDVRVTATVFNPGPNPSSLETSIVLPVMDSIGFSEGAIHAIETSRSITIPVVRRGLRAETASVHYNTMADSINGAASAGQDFIPKTGTLLFDPSQGTNHIVIDLIDDAAIERPEFFYVRLSDVAGDAALGSAVYLTNFIHDVPFQLSSTPSPPNSALGPPNETPPSATFPENAGFMQAYLWPLAGFLARVNITTVNESAWAGQDYGEFSETIRLPLESTNFVIRIPLLNDGISELATESLGLIARVAGAVQADDEIRLRLLIADNDTGFQFATSAVTNKETASQVQVTVLRGTDVAGEVSVGYTTSAGTAGAGIDFEVIEGTLVFGPNDQTKTFSIDLINDSFVEDQEFFHVYLRNPSAGTALGEMRGLTVLLRSEDSLLYFPQDIYYVPEYANAIAISVRRDGGLDSRSSVRFATKDGAALAGSDYTATSGTLVFEPGISEQYIVIPLLQDFGEETDEQFVVQLFDPSPDITHVGQTLSRVVIQDNDSKVSISFATNSYEFNELEGMARIMIIRSVPTQESTYASVTITPGTATQDLDYRVWNTSVSWCCGYTNTMLEIPLIDDSSAEADETITLRLTPGSNNNVSTALGSIPVATLIIKDPGTLVEFDRNQSLSATETNGSASVVVRRRGNADSTFSVPFRIKPLDALPGVDFSAEDGLLTFASGQITNTINFQLRDDFAVDGPKRLQLILAAPDNGATFYPNSTVVFTIADDEQPTPIDLILQNNKSTPSIAFLHLIYETPEGSHSASVSIRRTGESSQPISVQVRTTAGAATEGQDFQTFQSSFTLAQGQNAGEVLVTILDDGLVEPTEAFQLHLGNPSAGVLIAARDSVQLRILDNETRTTIDHRFQPILEGNLQGAVVSADAKVVAWTSHYDGSTGVQTVRLQRFLGDGSVDPSFTATVSTGPDNCCPSISLVKPLPDGKLLVAGYFQAVNVRTWHGLVRLLPDGALDLGFAPAAAIEGNNLSALAVQSDGKILASLRPQ